MTGNRYDKLDIQCCLNTCFNSLYSNAPRLVTWSNASLIEALHVKQSITNFARGRSEGGVRFLKIRLLKTLSIATPIAQQPNL